MTDTGHLRLTPSQQRYLAEIRAAGEQGRLYGRRSERPLAALEALGLITVEREPYMRFFRDRYGGEMTCDLRARPKGEA